MNRKITDHKVNGLNEAIEIAVTDEPGAGGANHRYEITGVDYGANPSAVFRQGEAPASTDITRIFFQNGPVGEAGFNGISNETLLAILIDRMRGFQYERNQDPAASAPTFDESKRGKYACRENAVALTKLEEAMMWLQKRTRDRMRRGVEGTHEK